MATVKYKQNQARSLESQAQNLPALPPNSVHQSQGAKPRVKQWGTSPLPTLLPLPLPQQENTEESCEKGYEGEWEPLMQ